MAVGANRWPPRWLHAKTSGPASASRSACPSRPQHGSRCSWAHTSSSGPVDRFARQRRTGGGERQIVPPLDDRGRRARRGRVGEQNPPPVAADQQRAEPRLRGPLQQPTCGGIVDLLDVHGPRVRPLQTQPARARRRRARRRFVQQAADLRTPAHHRRLPRSALKNSALLRDAQAAPSRRWPPPPIQPRYRRRRPPCEDTTWPPLATGGVLQHPPRRLPSAKRLPGTHALRHDSDIFGKSRARGP